MKKKIIVISFVIVGIIILVAMNKMNWRQEKQAGRQDTSAEEHKIRHYTCGMHPSVKIAPEDYDPEKTLCPICNMKLVPVYEEVSAGQELPASMNDSSETKRHKDHFDSPSEELSEKGYYGCGVDTQGKCPHCDLGQPDNRCICGGHMFTIEGQQMHCPVCSQPLQKLTKEQADKLKGVISRVKIKDEQAILAGVEIEKVVKVELFKEIRAVGKVAFDPELAVTEEEFIAAVQAYDKVRNTDILEIEESTAKLLASTKRKLKLLGLSDGQIEELEKTRQVNTGYILPEEKMWIYGDVYEYELSWVKSGALVEVATESLPGKIFHGTISSLNPVLDPKTRSVKFRAEVDNPGLQLKPEMYVTVIIKSRYFGPSGASTVLAVPKAAILDTGLRKIFWVATGAGEYEGREVVIGPEAIAEINGAEKYFYPVLKGLHKGEGVVTKANFLIDSQSQITGTAASAYGGAVGVAEVKSDDR